MLRRFTKQDLPAVMRLWLESNQDAHGFIPAAYWEENFSAVQAALPQAEVYVFEENGKILGFLGLQEEYIAGIFVEGKARSQGIGKALLEDGKSRKPRLTLRVYEKNTRAVAFYQREGFSVAARETDEATGEAEYTMIWEKTEKEAIKMFRKSKEGDCKAVYDLICDMEKKELPYEAFEAIYLRQLAREEQYCLIAEEAGQVCAMLHLRFEEQLHHCERIAEVMEFVVDARCRGQRLGQRMFAEAEKIAREHGCAQIEVASNQLRLDAHRFYIREGMHNFHYKFSKRLLGENSSENALGR